jgi:hypothetical protein
MAEEMDAFVRGLLAQSSEGTRRLQPKNLTAGTVYGMTHKTTVYFPEEMKRALEREAKRRDCSEAQVIRDAVAAAVSRPRPTAGLFEGESLSDHVDQLLVGFGER